MVMFTGLDFQCDAPYGGVFGPLKNKPLTQKEFDDIVCSVDVFSRIAAERSDFIARHSLHEDIYLRQNVWAQRFVDDTFRAIVSKKYNIINNLRLYISAFTDVRLWDMRIAEGLNPPGELANLPDAAGLDEIITRNLAPFEADLSRGYLPLVSGGNLTRDDIVAERLTAADFLKAATVMPARFVFQAPRKFCEVGWTVGDHVVNYDIASYQMRLNALYFSGISAWLDNRIHARGQANIIEIGSGYGALALALKSAWPGATVYLVDIAESLVFAHAYLTTALPAHRHIVIEDGRLPDPPSGSVVYVPNHVLGVLAERLPPMDLAVNTLSLPEMSLAQIQFYAGLISRLIGTSGVFFEQNKRKKVAVERELMAAFAHVTELPETAAPHKHMGDVGIWQNARHIL